jgi:hypothetical protein
MDEILSEFATSRSRETEVDRCRREIAAIERLIWAGHPDLEGLLLALADWSAELKLFSAESKFCAEAYTLSVLGGNRRPRPYDQEKGNHPEAV